MTFNPKTISSEMLAIKALELMQDNGISQLLAVEDQEYKGVVHLHNLINEGIL
jgi:arabinose-5-phosphate isomerase